MRVRISKVQLRALQTFADGGGPGESWAENGGGDRLAWYRHERTLDALFRKGLIDNNGITSIGTAILKAAQLIEPALENAARRRSTRARRACAECADRGEIDRRLLDLSKRVLASGERDTARVVALKKVAAMARPFAKDRICDNTWTDLRDALQELDALGREAGE